METALALLQLVTEKYPPPGKAQHTLCIGKETQGLRMYLQVPDGWQAIDFEEADLKLSPAELLTQIDELMASL